MRPAPGHAFGLDVLRALAVSSVLLAHGSLFHTAADSAARYLLIVFGVFGVEIFFALSGFLVGRQLLRVAEGEVGARPFLVRRWYRTLPNYFLFLAINAALAALALVPAGVDASYLVFAQSLAAPARGGFFPESWSLAVEEWFYLLGAMGFALAAWRRVTPRTLGLVLLAVVLAGPLLRHAAQLATGWPMDAGVRKVTLLRLDALAYGLGAAWLERYRPRGFARAAGWGARALALALLAVSFAALVALSVRLEFFEAARGAGWRAVASLLFSALPLAAALWIPWLSGWHRCEGAWGRPVGKVSQWSYAIYLTHLPTLFVMLSTWPVEGASAAGLALRTLAWLAIAIALAAFVYRFYEHPLTMRRPPLGPPG